MQIFDSYFDAGQELSQRDRERYYTALIEFVLYDKEPSLKGPALAVFTAIRPALELSKKRSESGAKGGSTTGKTQSNDEAKDKQDASKQEANGQAKSKSNNKRNPSPNGEGQRKPAAFTPPSIEEIRNYAKESGHPVDAERFHDFYASKGWMVGKNKMRDWKAAVRNWARGSTPSANPPPDQGGLYAEYD